MKKTNFDNQSRWYSLSAQTVATAGPAGGLSRSTPGVRPPEATTRRASVLAALGNRGLALVLLVAAAPILLAIPVVILCLDGWPAIYGGRRLGLRQRPFTMYKFRTLVNGAHRVVGGQLLSHDHKLTNRSGNFLRDTRLDELPQLVNILCGHMSFTGPRPERPEVYFTQCREISQYQRRFEVKPGLIGYSQLFTPHTTHKRFRALIDNRFLHRKPGAFFELLLIGYTAVVVLRTAYHRLIRFGRNRIVGGIILRGYKEKRKLGRVRVGQAWVRYDANGWWHEAAIMDINEAAFASSSRDRPPTTDSGFFFLHIEVRRHGRTRTKRATCTGRVSQIRETESGYSYITHFRPTTPASHYIVHQYFLKKSLAYPPVWLVFGKNRTNGRSP